MTQHVHIPTTSKGNEGQSLANTLNNAFILQITAVHETYGNTCIPGREAMKNSSRMRENVFEGEEISLLGH